MFKQVRESNILAGIAECRRWDVESLKTRKSLDRIRAEAMESPLCRDFAAALTAVPCAVIAEIKRTSPLKGRLRENFDICAMARIYEDNGAAAVSVITEERHFEGSPLFLREIRNRITLPLLRKDFVVDLYQIYEAKVLGADAVLIIAALVDEGSLRDFIDAAASTGLHSLVEVHDAREVQRALAAGASIIGINNRDLQTFRTDLDTTEQLAPLIPRNRIVVSESGIAARNDIERLRSAGVTAVLVGETLVRASDPGLKLRELLGTAGRHGN